MPKKPSVSQSSVINTVGNENYLLHQTIVSERLIFAKLKFCLYLNHFEYTGLYNLHVKHDLTWSFWFDCQEIKIKVDYYM